MRKVKVVSTKQELKSETRRELFYDSVNLRIDRVMSLDKDNELKVICMRKDLKYKLLERCEHYVLVHVEDLYFEVLKIKYYEDGRGFVTPNIQLPNDCRFASKDFDEAINYFIDRSEGKEIAVEDTLRDEDELL